jgi:hypothetical protein
VTHDFSCGVVASDVFTYAYCCRFFSFNNHDYLLSDLFALVVCKNSKKCDYRHLWPQLEVARFNLQKESGLFST